MEQKAPFDEVAADYDREFTSSSLGRRYRAAVWSHLDAVFEPGARILELGCGTGEDALWLARRGNRVVAGDASPAMLEAARRKVEDAGVGDRVLLRSIDMNRLAADLAIDDAPFDGALSNFGAVNCVADRRSLAAALAKRIRPGGRVVLVVMSPVCPWEVMWHLAKLRPATAFRRLRPGAEAAVGDSTVRVFYPTPRRLRREFAPSFEVRSTLGIGCLLPPPYLDHLARRWPRVVDRLDRVESRVRSFPPCSWFCDHFLLSLERKP